MCALIFSSDKESICILAEPACFFDHRWGWNFLQTCTDKNFKLDLFRTMYLSWSFVVTAFLPWLTQSASTETCIFLIYKLLLFCSWKVEHILCK